MNYKILRSVVFKDFKDNFYMTIKFSGILSLFLLIAYFILSLVLLFVPPLYAGILGQIFLLLVIWLLIYWIAPYFYSYYITNEVLLTIINGKDGGLSYFLANRRSGKRSEIRNALRIWRHLGFAILIYFISSIVVSITYFFISQAINSPTGLYSLITQINEISYNIGLTNEDKVQMINELINLNYSILHRYGSIVSFVSLSIAFYYFLHNIMKSFINYHCIFKANRRESNAYRILNYVLKHNNVNYYKDYYKIFYPFYIITFIVFTGVYLLMYFLLPNTITTIISSTSIIITLLILLPFLPLLLNYNHYKKIDVLTEYYSFLNRDINHFLNANKELFEEKEEEIVGINEENKNEDEDEFNPLMPNKIKLSKEQKDFVYNEANTLKALEIIYKYHKTTLENKVKEDNNYLKTRRKCADINDYLKTNLKEKSDEIEAISKLIENNFDESVLKEVYGDDEFIY